MGTRGLLIFLTLCLGLVSIYSRSVFDDMNDLKEKTNFGKNFPRQGLLLLCWLLGQGKIDQNGKLHLNFNPAENPFGFHKYQNYELTFPDMSNTNFEYFSLGNLFLKKAKKQLPSYIIGNIGTSRDHPQYNTDRVVIRIQKDNPTVVDELYITQHAGDFSQGSAYVKELTHVISKQLLKEIVELCNPDGDGGNRKHDEKDPDHQRFQHILGMFPNDPHLHLFLYQAGYDVDVDHITEHAKSNSPASSKHSESSSINLKLRATPNGQAKIVWEGIPDEMLTGKIKIGIYKDEYEDHPLEEYPVNGRTNGEINTDLTPSPGLQLRLLLLKPITIFETVYEGPKFDDDSIAFEPVQESYSFFSFSNLFSIVF